jgi:antitoxin CcdA
VIAPRRFSLASQDGCVGRTCADGRVEIRKPGERARMVEIVVSEQDALDVLDRMAGVLDAVLDGTGVERRAGIDEREHVVLDEIGVHTGQFEPVDAVGEFGCWDERAENLVASPFNSSFARFVCLYSNLYDNSQNNAKGDNPMYYRDRNGLVERIRSTDAMTETVSAKVPDDMKRDIEREDVNVSEVIREALADELTRRRREKFLQRADALGERIGDSVTSDDIVQAVRETREEQ